MLQVCFYTALHALSTLSQWYKRQRQQLNHYPMLATENCSKWVVDWVAIRDSLICLLLVVGPSCACEFRGILQLYLLSVLVRNTASGHKIGNRL